MHQKIYNLVESNKFKNFIMFVIVINAITLGFETSKYVMQNHYYLIEIADKLAIAIFTIEIFLRIYAHRIAFFKDGWSLFDFTIVAISLFPTTGIFDIFRVLRILRVLRLVTVSTQMRKIVSSLISIIPSMGSIAGLMFIFFYIAAVMATQLYGESFPQWFGSLGKSFYTLFQIMTLESWSMGIARPIMQVHPYAWAFFIPFIFVVTFVMINLIVAVVVDAMATINESEKEEIQKVESNQIEALRSEIQELKEMLQEHHRT